MTSKQENTKNTLIVILIALTGFLGGTNISGWAVSTELHNHEKTGGHAVMEARMDRIEDSVQRLMDMQTEYNEDQKRILIELNAINKKLGE